MPVVAVARVNPCHSPVDVTFQVQSQSEVNPYHIWVIKLSMIVWGGGDFVLCLCFALPIVFFLTLLY